MGKIQGGEREIEGEMRTIKERIKKALKKSEEGGEDKKEGRRG